MPQPSNVLTSYLNLSKEQETPAPNESIFQQLKPRDYYPTGGKRQKSFPPQSCPLEFFADLSPAIQYEATPSGPDEIAPPVVLVLLTLSSSRPGDSVTWDAKNTQGYDQLAFIRVS